MDLNRREIDRIFPTSNQSFQANKTAETWLGDAIIRMTIAIGSYNKGAAFGLILHTFKICPSEKFLIDRLPRVYDPAGSTSTGDASVLDLARTWLQDCLETHPKCRQQKNQFYPSRLIDLAPGFEIGRCRLIETSPKLRGGYLSLSHRWGPKTPRLTVKSYQDFVAGVSWRSMPGVFRDACRVARILRIRYLWIDSICIFQDNKADVSDQLQQMQDIYSNAVCNLSALTASAESLFVSRTPLAIGSRNVPLSPLKHRVDTPVMLRDEDLWVMAVDISALAERGWVLQEQLLAQRTLYFSANQILWDCREGRCSETYPALCGAVAPRSDHSNGSAAKSLYHYSPLDEVRETIGEATSFIHRNGTHLPQNFGKEYLMSGWCKFVTQYSRKQLTFEEDRLPAISGIAKQFAQATQYNWAAGLWLEQMPEILLWDTRSSVAASQQSRGRGPTWSWASLGRPCHFSPSILQDPFVVSKVLGVKCKTVDGNPFGTVSEGTLRLLAPILELSIDIETGEAGIQSSNGSLFPLRLLEDAEDCPFKSVSHWPPVESREMPHNARFRPLGQDIVGVVITTKMKNISQDRLSQDGLSPHILRLSAIGLVLERVKTLQNWEQNPTFRRIALFEFQDYECVNIPPGWPLEIFRESDDTDQQLDFDSADFLTELTII